MNKLSEDLKESKLIIKDLEIEIDNYKTKISDLYSLANIIIAELGMPKNTKRDFLRYIVQTLQSTLKKI